MVYFVFPLSILKMLFNFLTAFMVAYENSIICFITISLFAVSCFFSNPTLTILFVFGFQQFGYDVSHRCDMTLPIWGHLAFFNRSWGSVYLFSLFFFLFSLYLIDLFSLICLQIHLFIPMLSLFSYWDYLVIILFQLF